MADENKIIANLSFEQIKELISAVSSANLGKLTVETERPLVIVTASGYGYYCVGVRILLRRLAQTYP